MATAGAADGPAGEHQAHPAQREGRQPGEGGLQRDGRDGRRPGHALRHQRDHEGAVARAGAVGAGHRTGELAGPEGAEGRQRRHRVTGGGDGPEQQRRGGRLVRRRKDESVGQQPRAGQRPGREELGPEPTYQQGRDHGQGADAEGDHQHPHGQRSSGEDHEGRQADGADEAVQADADQGVPSAEAGSREPPHPPEVGADVSRGQQPQKLGLGVRPQVPDPTQVATRQRPPAQRAEEVLADHPGDQAEQDGQQGDVGQTRQRDGRDDQAHRDTQDEDGARVQHLTEGHAGPSGLEIW